MAKYTLAFSEVVKGFTSFFSFIPDWMISLNNNFYSIKDGNLYKHDSDNVNYNTFYGVQYPSKVSILVNGSPSDVKILQALAIEGNFPWNAVLGAYVDMASNPIQSTLDELEFVQKEGMWYSYVRRNEDATQVDSKAAYGIGVITGIAGTVVTVDGFSGLLTTNDVIKRGADLTTGGAVQTFSRTGDVTTITLDAIGTLQIGDFILGTKTARIEGGNLRGYTFRIDLEVTQDVLAELFAVNSEVKKSFT